jgi:hypothetical protein
MDSWNKCGCEATMAREKICSSEESVQARRQRSQGGRREMAAVTEMFGVLSDPLLTMATMRGHATTH